MSSCYVCYNFIVSFIVTLVSIIQAHTVSLGVGASTLAVLNFFKAIADGTIDPTERRMMGVVYIVLRVAMVLILITTLFLVVYQQINSSSNELSAFSFGQITVLVILFLNAFVMTLGWMPSTFGPAIQAGSWYTLGTLSALFSVGLTEFSYLEFLLGYLTWVILAVSIVNGVMAYMKAKADELEEASEIKQNPA